MILSYSKLIGLPIMEIKEQTKVGAVADFIINLDLSLAGVLLQNGFWQRENKVVSAIDIIHLLKNGVVVKDVESAIATTEVVRITELLKQNSFGLNQQVVSETGEKIGTVYDYMIDSELLAITKFCVKSLISDRIILVKNVIDFDGRKITIKSKAESKVEMLSSETVTAN